MIVTSLGRMRSTLSPPQLGHNQESLLETANRRSNDHDMNTNYIRRTSTIIQWAFLLAIGLSLYSPEPACSQGLWQRDFDLQRPERRPTLEARYTSAARDGFLVEAERYTIRLDLRGSKRHAVAAVLAGPELSGIMPFWPVLVRLLFYSAAVAAFLAMIVYIYGGIRYIRQFGENGKNADR